MVSGLTAPAMLDVAPATDWTLHAADGLVPLAAVDTFESCVITARFNAVSAWELVLPTATEACQVLVTAARPRLVVTGRDGETFRSGPPIDFTREITDTGDMTTITGVDDLVWLARRLAHPQPGTAAPPYSSTAYDVRTATVAGVIFQYVNVNAGPGAVAARRVPDLTCEVPTVTGPTITRRLRYQNLLEAVARFADGAGLGIEVVDMVFRVFQPTGNARFSVELGTLAGSTASLTAPEANYVYVGGSGEGTARVIVETADTESVTTWGRSESFVDRRDTSNPADLTSEAVDTLAELVTRPVVDMEAVDTEGQRFGIDWGLGSVARVILEPGGTPFEEIIREVVVELRPNAPASIRPSLGGAVDMALWKELATTNARIRALEVR